MNSFLNQDFLLDTPAARKLYHEAAAGEPILDFHSHLPPDQIAGNSGFENLAQLWLGGDHYKWRLMRSNGVPEADITGHPADERTFRAWARTVPQALGNPIYHWTHLELRRTFGIDDVLSEATAASIWARANEQIASPEFRVHRLLKDQKVVAVCTTDDPCDDLGHHRAHAAAGSPGAVMAPTFRPDKLLAPSAPGWADQVARLEKVSGLRVGSYADLVKALASRHTVFHEAGCRLSDHALVVPPGREAPPEELEATFRKARSGDPLTAVEAEGFQAALLAEVAGWNRDRDWAMQLHMGAQRNLNSPQFRGLGPDTGYDAISDQPLAIATAKLLDLMLRRGPLPKVILYTLNPSATEALGSVMGAFQDGTEPGKIQLGSAWWFNDHIDGMDQQLRALGNLGLLPRFVGMLTDSRSFLSFPRHEYFRRILCRLVGRWMDGGLVPDDFRLTGGLVKAVCFANARAYFRLPGV